MKEYKISEELAQAILNYLAVQSYKDVAGLISGLMSITNPVAEAVKKPEPKK